MFNQLPVEMNNYWNIQYFHGILPPRVVNSEEAMIRFIANTPDAVGYVLSGHEDKRVKSILKLKIHPVKNDQ
jgi:hypothetical protein